MKKICIIDDNSHDISLLIQAFKECGHKGDFLYFKKELEMIDYIENNDNENIGLFIIDLNVLKSDGFEIIEKIKSNENYKYIPFIIYSGSQLQLDIDKALEAGASGYFNKPYSYDLLSNLIKTIYDYWFVYNSFNKEK